MVERQPSASEQATCKVREREQHVAECESESPGKRTLDCKAEQASGGRQFRMTHVHTSEAARGTPSWRAGTTTAAATAESREGHSATPARWLHIHTFAEVRMMWRESARARARSSQTERLGASFSLIKEKREREANAVEVACSAVARRTRLPTRKVPKSFRRVSRANQRRRSTSRPERVTRL